MDQATEERWRQGYTPFDGLTLYTQLLPTEMLLRATRMLVDFLERQTTCRRLRTFDDWHEHDGYNEAGVEVSWGQLSAAVKDEQSFRAASPDDDLVRRAWLAEDASFYLRWFWYPQETGLFAAKSEDPAEGGDVDLTGPPAVVTKAQQALASLDVQADLRPAKEFFARRWAG